jgi:environmental stress-induced protein Ves
VAITHLRSGGYRRMPWRNGAGTTTEIAVFPPGAGFDEFRWRLAIADLDRSGPFSSFPGIDRLLMLLPPGRATLTIDGEQHPLAPLGVLPFRGEAAASVTLAAGPARDLNLMTRRAEAVATMEAIELGEPARRELRGGHALACAIEGRVEVEVAGATALLEPLDSALCEVAAGAEATVTLRPLTTPATLAWVTVVSRGAADA